LALAATHATFSQLVMKLAGLSFLQVNGSCFFQDRYKKLSTTTAAGFAGTSRPSLR